MCPHCHTAMHRYPGPDGHERWYCSTCPRVARRGDTTADIEAREAHRRHALTLIDTALGPRAVRREEDRRLLGELEPTLGRSVRTRGCPRCRRTMYRTVETDTRGNPTAHTQWVCAGCGHVV